MQKEFTKSDFEKWINLHRKRNGDLKTPLAEIIKGYLEARGVDEIDAKTWDVLWNLAEKHLSTEESSEEGGEGGEGSEDEGGSSNSESEMSEGTPSKSPKSKVGAKSAGGKDDSSILTLGKPPLNEIEDEDIEGFIKLFKDRAGIAGTGESYKRAVEWLTSKKGGAVKKKIVACFMFTAKPMKYLITGATSSSASAGEVLNTKIIDYLPMLDLENKRKVVEMKTRPESWGEFRFVNQSRARVVSYMVMELYFMSEVKPFHSIFQEMSAYLGNEAPSMITKDSAHITRMKMKDGSENKESKRITLERLDLFKAERKLWHPLLAEVSKALK
jgi:hypothetical protein